MYDRTNEGEAFVSDERRKIGTFNYNSFPYTVDFEEEDEISGTFTIPTWVPPRSHKMSVYGQ